jgi:DNA-binding LytR/AlgR family response regulator
MLEKCKHPSESLSTDPEYIYVKSDYKLVQIPLNQILYVEGLKDYIKIHLEGESKAVLSLISMKVMEERLPSDRFIRVHRSFIVQKSKIKVIDRGRIVFNKEYIPVSDSYKQELHAYINERSIQ